MLQLTFSGAIRGANPWFALEVYFELWGFIMIKGANTYSVKYWGVFDQIIGGLSTPPTPHGFAPLFTIEGAKTIELQCETWHGVTLLQSLSDLPAYDLPGTKPSPYQLLNVYDYF